MKPDKAFFIMLSLILLVPQVVCFAGIPTIVWSTSISSDEMPTLPRICQAENGNIYIVEQKFDRNKNRIYTLFWKYSNDGRKIFEKYLEAPWGEEFDSSIDSIIVTKDEKIFLFCNTRLDPAGSVWVLEYDSEGNQKNIKSYNYKEQIVIRKVIEIDNQFLVLGVKAFNRSWMARFDKDGSKNWERVIENGRDEELISAALDKNNRLCILTTSVGQDDKFGIGKTTLFLGIYTLNGEKVKEYSLSGRVTSRFMNLGNIITDDSLGENFLLTYDDNVLPNGNICNTANLTEGYNYILKISSDLDVVWRKRYKKKVLIIGTPLIGKTENGYIAVGTGNLSPTSNKAEPSWLAVLDDQGNVLSEIAISQARLMPTDLITNDNYCLVVGTGMNIIGGKPQNNVIILKVAIE
jgi:hypothetical protein